MDYQQTLDYLFTQTPVFQRDGASAYKPGLDTSLELARLFGNPHRRFRTIHVAGTNGKGSVSHTLAAVLAASGLRTGLYTSPHLTDFRERIRVNGEMIPHRAVTDFVARYLAMPEASVMHPSFFELTMTMAFDWFACREVDIAVVEVGLGGLLDSTNIITPELSIITNISKDHTALLGHTAAEIAAQKAGIIKPGVPVVVGSEEPAAEVGRVLRHKAAEVGAPYHTATPVEAVAAPDRPGWLYGPERIYGELAGDFQRQNAATVLTALRVLNLPEVTAEAVARGLGHVTELTGLRGRLTTVQTEPFTLVYDTGHNPGAWEYLSEHLKRVEAPRLTLVIGFAADKDVDSILAMMPRHARYFFARPTGNRGMDAAELAERAARHCLHGQACESVEAAAAEAISTALPGEYVFVGGSNFVIADFLRSLG